ncbi:hypothetical protein GF407_03305 [candidate division KSB1 bacterium]|nr:hypothetical protein [candidate division KSB1 bacterium]
MKRTRLFTLLMVGLIFFENPVAAGDFEYPVRTIENMFYTDSLRILQPQPIRYNADDARRALLVDSSDFMLKAKIKPAAEGGKAYNNEPRLELAAYILQKMFLDSSEYVVPPTAIRAFTPQQFNGVNPEVQQTFTGSPLIFCTLQYWLPAISDKNVYNEKRLRRDSLYAYHWGNLNAFTYIIHHNDGNIGNVVVSTDSLSPHVYAVDNGISFDAPESRRGSGWRDLRLQHLPRKTFERLQEITLQDLEDQLAVCAQFDLGSGDGRPVSPTPVIDPYRGVRVEGDTVQFGLTKNEIRHLHERIRYLIRLVEDGEIGLF